MKNKYIGKIGEEEAVNYLLVNDFRVVYRNYRYKRNEVDIIAQKGDFIIFIEVKKRKNASFGRPEEFVSEGQQKRIIEAAEHFIKEHQINKDVRFDIIALQRGKLLHHIKNAWCMFGM